MVLEIRTTYLKPIEGGNEADIRSAIDKERLSVISAIRSSLPKGVRYAPAASSTIPVGNSMRVIAIDYFETKGHLQRSVRRTVKETIAAIYGNLGISLAEEPLEMVYNASLLDFERMNRYAFLEVLGHQGAGGTGKVEFSTPLNTISRKGNGRHYIVRTTIEIGDTKTQGFGIPEWDIDEEATGTINEDTLRSFLPSRLEIENGRYRDILAYLINEHGRLRFFTGAVINVFDNPFASSAVIRRADIIEVPDKSIREKDAIAMIRKAYRKAHYAFQLMAKVNLLGVTIEPTDIAPTTAEEYVHGIDKLRESMKDFPGIDDRSFEKIKAPNDDVLNEIPNDVLLGIVQTEHNYYGFVVFNIKNGIREKDAWKILHTAEEEYGNALSDVVDDFKSFGLPDKAEDVEITYMTSDLAMTYDKTSKKAVLIVSVSAPDEWETNAAIGIITKVLDAAVKKMKPISGMTHTATLPYPADFGVQEAYESALRLASIQDYMRKMR